MKKIFKCTIPFMLAVILLLATGCAPKTTQSASAAPSGTTANAPAASASGTSSGDDVIKIGLVTSLSGPFAFGSNEVKNANTLAIQDRGEVLGKKLVLEIGDANDATEAMSEFERLYADGVRIFVGGYTPFTDLAIEKVVDERNCLFLCDVGWEDEFTATKINNFFHFTPTLTVYGQRIAENITSYAEKYLGKSSQDLKVAVIWNTNADTVGQTAIRELEKANINIVLKEGYSGDRKDFAPLIAKLQSANVDVLVPCQLSEDGIPFRQKMIEMGYEPPMLFAMGLVYDMPDFGNLDASVTNGCMVLSYTSPVMNRALAPGLDKFAEEYKTAYGWYPLTHATQAYSGALFLFDMMEKAGTTDVATLSNTIANCDVPAGVYPNYWGVKFDDHHRNIRAGDPLVVGQWQNGKCVAVGPEALKTGEAIIPWDASKLGK